DARVKLNDLIAGTDLQTFYGPIRFASEGDHFHNNTALDPMLVQIQAGRSRRSHRRSRHKRRSSTRSPRWAAALDATAGRLLGLTQ
ncbi:MAG TPA: hypothetical protein VER34_02680, partial [Mycobacterium sp.]|nr:hypothetical protein [Mycobacterium sp.]